MSLAALDVVRRTGFEHFHKNGEVLPFDLLSFWQWSSSDLVGNALRGIIAKYLVARAVGAEETVRKEWDAYDILMRDGTKVEVKSSAYVQSWHQDKLSAISFD